MNKTKTASKFETCWVVNRFHHSMIKPNEIVILIKKLFKRVEIEIFDKQTILCRLPYAIRKETILAKFADVSCGDRFQISHFRVKSYEMRKNLLHALRERELGLSSAACSQRDRSNGHKFDVYFTLLC